MRPIFLILAILLCSTAGAAAPPRPFLDLDFEAQECTSGWETDGWIAYEATMDGSVVQSGSQSLRLRYMDSTPWEEYLGPVNQAQVFPGATPAGKRVRFGGAIQTQGVTGYAALWWTSFDATGRVLSHVETEGVTGTSPWARHEMEIAVPRQARRITFGAKLQGDGTAWFDALTLHINGQPWVDGPAPALPTPSPAAVSWLRNQAIPLDTHEPGNASGDLQPLKKLIGNARIVSLGEASHGTREIFQMKHRLLEFLVHEMGFTLFAMEANMPEAQRINHYVLTGQGGNPDELLDGLYFWTWDTQEVLDMIHWMRAHNATAPPERRVQFLGIDGEFTYVAVYNVRDFLSRADPGYLTEAEAILARVEETQPARPATAEHVNLTRRLLKHMESRRADYLTRFPREEVDWMIQNARVLVQAMQSRTGIGTQRDENMAQNVDWILRQAPAGSKIVLWAHNGHVNRKPEFLGHYLNRRFGRSLFTVGFALDEGRYNSYGLEGIRDYEILPTIPGSVESFLDSAGVPRFLLDVRRVPNGAPATWLRQPRGFRLLYELAERCAFHPEVIANQYDALIWIESSTPTRLLR